MKKNDSIWYAFRLQKVLEVLILKISWLYTNVCLANPFQQCDFLGRFSIVFLPLVSSTSLLEQSWMPRTSFIKATKFSFRGHCLRVIFFLIKTHDFLMNQASTFTFRMSTGSLRSECKFFSLSFFESISHGKDHSRGTVLHNGRVLLKDDVFIKNAVLWQVSTYMVNIPNIIVVDMLLFCKAMVLPRNSFSSAGIVTIPTCP